MKIHYAVIYQYGKPIAVLGRKGEAVALPSGEIVTIDWGEKDYVLKVNDDGTVSLVEPDHIVE